MFLDFPHFSLEKRTVEPYDPTTNSLIPSGTLCKKTATKLVPLGSGDSAYAGVVYGVFKGTEVGYVRECKKLDVLALTTGVQFRTDNLKSGDSFTPGARAGWEWVSGLSRCVLALNVAGPYEVDSVEADGSVNFIVM